MSHCAYCHSVIFEEQTSIKITKTGGTYHLVGGAASCYNLALMDALLAKRKEKRDEK